MGRLLFVALIVVPIIEIAVFINVGGVIGLWPTLAVVILTAVAGTFLLRQQGLATLMRAQHKLSSEELPLAELFDGACILFAGALLLTPGFVTDGVGLLLMAPPVRRTLGKHLWRALSSHVDLRGFPAGAGPGVGPGAGPAGGGAGGGAGDGVIDGDYEEITPAPGELDDQRRR